MIVLDIESTGLDPNNDVMLELGMLHVTDDLDRVLGEFQTLIHPLPGTPLSDFIREMHGVERSRLLVDLVETQTNPVELRDAEMHALAFLESTGTTPGSEPMVGSTISFDRGFLKVHMPTVEARFHYRNIDVSSVKELVRRWRAPVYAGLPEGRKTHRALPDCYDTLNELRFYKSRVLDYLTSPYSPIFGPA